MPALYPPNVAADQAAVGASDAVKLGGALQGQVAANFNNQGSADCYVYPVGDGSTPSAADVIAMGTLVPSGGNFAPKGVVQGIGDGTISPQYWAATVSSTTVVSWSERLWLSEERG